MDAINYLTNEGTGWNLPQLTESEPQVLTRRWNHQIPHAAVGH
jgi:hypothetical protein